MTESEISIGGGQRPSPAAFWNTTGLQSLYKPLDGTCVCDVAVVGGGISGALIAEHLASRGLSVAIVDANSGANASLASAGMLHWELDVPLSELTHYYGFERAVGVYRRSAAAVTGLSRLIAERKIDCGLKPRKTLYLAGNQEGARDLLEEVKLRRKAGLPGLYLEHCDLFTQFEIDRDAAILSPGSAEVDPATLIRGLLASAQAHGALLVQGRVQQLHDENDRVTVAIEGAGSIDAAHVVLASGHSFPGIEMPGRHRTTSSFAMATGIQPAGSFWREQSMLWEDSHPYLYMRTTSDGRILAGGEDDLSLTKEERNVALATKARAISEEIQRLWPKADAQIETAWCGSFSETTDGIPLIGRVPAMRNVYAATGYGGNGLTFAYLAALMIGAMVSGVERDWFEDFALDRDSARLRDESFSAGFDSSENIKIPAV